MIKGHGIDIVHIPRIAASIERHGSVFTDKIFTEAEVEYCESSAKLRAERYASRFAAKEAFFKALGTGWRYGMAWTEVAVVKDAEGKPELNISGKALEIAHQRGHKSWLLSLSHAHESAIASVITLG